MRIKDFFVIEASSKPKDVVFFANVSAVGVAIWRRSYQRIGRGVSRLWTIHARTPAFPEVVQAGFRFLPKPLRYVALGLRGRVRAYHDDAIVHAHGASGYGLSAMLTGKPYIVTVYGSEVFDERRGLAFRAIVRAVLLRARAITVSASFARDYIVRAFGVPRSKIFCFHPGVDTERLDDVFASAKPKPGEGRSYLSIRNAAPQYRTLDVIEAFLKSAAPRDNGSLTVIEGNGDKAYWGLLRRRFENCPEVRFVSGLIPHSEFLKLVHQHDVCVSYPVTDQMSTTVLEALYLAKVLICSDLEVYSELFSPTDLPGTLRVRSPDDLSRAFTATINGPLRSDYRERIRARYSLTQSAASLTKLLAVAESHRVRASTGTRS